MTITVGTLDFTTTGTDPKSAEINTVEDEIEALLQAVVDQLGALAERDDVDTAQVVNDAITAAKLSAAALKAMAGVTPAANKLAYFDGASSAALADLTAFARSILDDGDAATVRATLGLGALAVLATVDTAQIESDAVTAAKIAAQALKSLAGVTPAADRLPYFDGASSAALTVLTGFARTLLDDSDAGTARTTLGLGGLATKDTVGSAEIDADAVINAKLAAAALKALGALTPAANKLAYFDGASSAALADLTAYGRTLVALADAAAGRSALGLGDLSTLDTIGTNDIDADAVTSAKIAADAVTNTQIADKAVGRAKLAQPVQNELTDASGIVLWTTDYPDHVLVANAGAIVSEPDDRRDRLAAEEARGSITLWTTDYPDRVEVVQTGARLEPADITLWSTDYAHERVEVNADGGLRLPSYPTHLYNEGTDYTDDPTYVAPAAGFLHHVHAIGQSYTQGLVGARYSTSAAHAGVALMLDSGIMPVGSPSDGFADLVAGQYSGNDYEPPVVSAINHMVGALETALGESPKMVGSVSAFGGKAYLELMRGSSRWLESRRIMQEVRRHALALGLQPEMPVLMIHEGEQDAVLANSSGAFSNADGASVEMAVGHLMRWHQDHWDMAREIYGQARPPVAVCYVTNRSFYSGELLMTPWQAAVQEAARRAPHLFVVAGPAYAVEHQGSGDTNPFHPTVLGSRRLGDMMGRAALAAAYSTGFQPCQIVDARWVSTSQIKLRCHVPWGGSLAKDTSEDIVGDPGADCGFNVETDSGAISVSSVAVSGQTITLNLASAGTIGGTRVSYAVRGDASSISGDNTDMARGIIRGSVAHTLADSGSVDSHDFLLPSSFIM